MPFVSVVVPTYNEPAPDVWLDALAALLREIAPRHEIVIVDDSGDAARQELQRSLAHVPSARLIAGGHRGKGAAVRLGIDAANGDVILCIDADFPADRFDLILEFVVMIDSGGYDVAIAERRSKWQFRSPGRFLLSFGLFLAQRGLVFQSTRFFDTQCGFKAYRRDAAKQIAARQRVDGGMYDIEYLYIAVQNKLRIGQIPIVPPREVRPSRIRVLHCLRIDPPSLLRIKMNGLLGRYRFGSTV